MYVSKNISKINVSVEWIFSIPKVLRADKKNWFIIEVIGIKLIEISKKHVGSLLEVSWNFFGSPTIIKWNNFVRKEWKIE